MTPSPPDPAGRTVPEATLEDLFARLADRSTPALVWHGGDGGRIELSGRVLENWAAKTANLLVDDLGMTENDRLLLDDAVHWRTLVVALGAWRLGAGVMIGEDLPDDVAGGGVLVTTTLDRTGAQPLPDPAGGAGSGGRAAAAARADEHLVLAYPGLAMRAPDGATTASDIDYCAEIRSQGDRWSQASSPADDGPAVIGARATTTFAELLEQVDHERQGLPHQPVARLMGARWTAQALVRVLALWRAGGTAVLSDRAPSPQLDRDLAAERVTLTWS